MDFPMNEAYTQTGSPQSFNQTAFSTYIPSSPSSLTSNVASSAPQGTPALNPRSCVICRRRKVRCNKQYPCSNCAKAKVQCIFPAPERAKRRPRKPPDGELLSRLRRLEGVIQGMGMSVEDELANSDGHSTGQSGDQQKQQNERNSQSGSYSSVHPSPIRDSISQAPTPHSPDGTVTGDFSNDFSRLVVNEGKSRYVNNRFWATLSNEVEDLRGILDESTDEEIDVPSPSTEMSSPPADGAYFFRYSSIANDLYTLHPPPDHIWEHWQTYKEYIDPVMKIVHVPSMETQIQAFMRAPSKSSKHMEPFLFAVYFSSVTALSPEDCQLKFGESRDALVKRFKFAVEQGLARANFLISEEMIVLQAFITFLVCLRSHEDGRVLWSLIGVVIRTAVSMGLHRDGSNFNLSPFEVEMRRRCWWQIVALEFRSSHDTGIEPMVLAFPYDTKLPLNVNDEELSPSMARLPDAQKGITDTTFCILRYDVQKTLYKMWDPTATLQQKESWITECHTHLEQNYFNSCDMSKSVDWTICTVAKLIMARQFLLLYHPHIKTLQQGTIDRLFVTALDTIEFALRLETERKLVKWGWLFRTYNQWHALAFLLSELTRRTKGPLVQRAWRAVNSTLAEYKQNNHDHNRRGQLWRPLVKLLHTARTARERELAREAQQQNVQLDPQLMPPGGETNASIFQPTASGASLNTASNGQNGGGSLKSRDENFANGANSQDSNLRNMPMLESSVSSKSNPIDDQYLFDNTSNNVPANSQFFANTGLWQNYSAGQGLAGDWFNNWASDNNVNMMPEFDSSTLQDLSASPQAFGLDPMVSGSDAQGVQQWTDWDEVMKEFETGPIAGQPSAKSQWGNKPGLMGETWL